MSSSTSGEAREASSWAPGISSYNHTVDDPTVSIAGGVIQIPVYKASEGRWVKVPMKKDSAGIWFTGQSEQVLQRLMEAFAKSSTPDEAEMAALARELGAPGVAQIRTFFQNMEQKYMEHNR